MYAFDIDRIGLGSKSSGIVYLINQNITSSQLIMNNKRKYGSGLPIENIIPFQPKILPASYSLNFLLLKVSIVSVAPFPPSFL